MVAGGESRQKVLEYLRREVMGPAPHGTPIDCSGDIRFETWEEFERPYCQADTGEEILQFDRPTRRYGVGVLYPPGTPVDDLDEDRREDGENQDISVGSPFDLSQTDLYNDAPRVQDSGDEGADEPDPADFDLSLVNAYMPSAMAVSFLATLPSGSKVEVEVTGGRYIAKTVTVAGHERTWWLRQPVRMTAVFDGQQVASQRRATPLQMKTENTDGLDLSVEVYSRPYDDNYILTVCLVNRTKGARPLDEQSLFQSRFSVTVVLPDNSPAILPYPETRINYSDPEEASLALLYRRAQTYAVGHGCAADWVQDGVGFRARTVVAECLPWYETPSLTPVINDANGETLEVSMPALAGLLPNDDGFASLEKLAAAYEKWIQERENEATTLSHGYKEAANRNLQACRQMARRIRDGIAYLRENPIALEAFRLANHAILLQQLRQKPGTRIPRFDKAANRIVFDEPLESPDPAAPAEGRGKWRPFQIAFILATIRSIAEDQIPERELVDLLWFPTGGGKTEAYLGLAAFAIFLRRLKDGNDKGVHVIMRYTLRLLTAQQFQRAASLICAMEYLRRQKPEKLGESEISIGVWLGGGTTPNTHEEARRAYRELQGRSKATLGNPFVLDRCPWCRAYMGRAPFKGRDATHAPKVLGYQPLGKTIKAVCPDSRCAFSTGLPVYVIDQDIYDKRPDLLIGTVDKFALLAWRADARSLFGIGEDGGRIASPPGLIIQDELHLISGPLGSMVGLYELLVEELSTDRRSSRPIRPKIIASTATIRRYAEQIRSLYGRRAQLFPPPGLDAGDSFFARYARDSSGKPAPGRLYVGILGPGFGSMQTAQVRTISALLQAPMNLSEAERDPWWTVLAFFNSLRELGTTVSLLQSDIPDYLRAIKRREGLQPHEVRWVRKHEELTGRIRSEEIPEKMRALEIPYGKKGTVDVCLASNIIEVGIDIERLSLMVVVGQPKSTSQYIQVTGRIGRKWWERPGLVVTLYSPTKPRDRSHYEKFRTYHERLYAQVEPTSVTPFASPVLDRALHAVMVAYVRQLAAMNVSPRPFPEDMLNRLKTLVLERVAVVDPKETDNLKAVFERRARQWKRWSPIVWTSPPGGGQTPLIRPAGEYMDPEIRDITWPVPRSLRNVDAECQAEITVLYLREHEEADDA